MYRKQGDEDDDTGSGRVSDKGGDRGWHKREILQ
jgi:hypothetical protein